MSKIEQLIQQLCPEGVEYKRLGEVCEMRNGYTPSKSKPEYWEDGNIPWFRMEDIRTNGRILSDSIQHITTEGVKGKGLFPANSIILATTATIGEHALIIVDSLANQRFTNLSIRKSLESEIDIKFFFYYMFIVDEWCKNNTNPGTFASVDTKKLANVLIPLPPLPVQQEIVRILDAFTQLEAELEAELEARKKQYAYYRDTLLSFEHDDPKVEWKRLGEVVRGISSGKNKTRNNEGQYPVYGSTGIIAKTDEYVYDKKQILIARVGAYAGYVHIADGKYDVSDNAIIVDLKDDVSFKYIYHLLTNLGLNKYAKGGGQPLVTASQMKQISIPLPPLSVQQEIVRILDKFSALTSDLQSGLPAEIEARKKQYEYYRDRLLTFKRKEA